MPKFSTITLSVGLALGATQSLAEGDLETVIRMAILGTQSGETPGVFSTEAVSLSIGLGSSVLGGVVVDPDSGALGTAVAVGEGDLDGSLVGFDTVSQYETSVCVTEDGCASE